MPEFIQPRADTVSASEEATAGWRGHRAVWAAGRPRPGQGRGSQGAAPTAPEGGAEPASEPGTGTPYSVGGVSQAEGRVRERLWECVR